MKVKKVLKNVHIKNDWTKVDLGNFTDFYLIAKKNSKKKSDTVDPTVVQRIRFEVGIASGIKKNPLTIGYLTMNFKDVTSTDLEVNDKTAMLKICKYPSVFYMRPVEFYDGTNIIREGKSSIDITVCALKLE